jgi:hypothetical protein
MKNVQLSLQHMKIKNCYFASLLLFSSLLARESPNIPEPLPPEIAEPWLTGPLLTPSASVVPKGHQNYEPYLYWTVYNGIYDTGWKSQSKPKFTSLTFQPTCQFGIAQYTELNITPQIYYQWSEGAKSWALGDFPVTVGVQVLRGGFHDWYPNIKLRFSAVFPTGKYQRLNPSKKGTDEGGFGSWFPQLSVVFGKRFHVTGYQWIITRLLVGYVVGTPVRVHGRNSYGGAAGTRGTVYPGNTTVALFGAEYTLNLKWVLALDAQYSYTQKTRFSGKTGGVVMKDPPGQLFSLAPAVEYNFTQRVGLIAGSWFTIAGQNNVRFWSAIIALNIYV